MSLTRTTIVLLAAAALAGCASGASTGGSTAAPTPAGSAASANGTAARASNALPAGVTARMVALGDSLFHARSCARCHGPDAEGARNGPDLTTTTHLHIDGSYDSFVRIIMSGVPADQIKDSSHQFAMRARGGGRPALTDDEVRAVAAYVYTLSHQ